LPFSAPDLHSVVGPLGRDLEPRVLLIISGQAARSDEENPGDECGFHRFLQASDLLLLTGFLVFYQR
jgi:hypothetical protein